MIKKVKNKKGFSMAELLLALLIISIVLAASMPTVVRSAKSGRENIWQWMNVNTSAYFGKNSNQKLLIGLATVPTYDIVNPPEKLTPELNGRVSVLKEYGIANSHIDLLDADGNYSARIAASPTNIAFGKDVLANVNEADKPDDPENTTSFNTGIGNEALQDVLGANGNTGVGFRALNHNRFGNSNTAIGANAGKDIIGGEDSGFTGGNTNTLIGYEAGAEYAPTSEPSINTDIPESNTIVGANACNNTLYKNAQRNICIGYNVQNVKQNSSDLLLIGSNTQDSNTYTYVPLITGHTNYHKNTDGDITYNKEIEFNVEKFNIKSFDGRVDVFSVTTEKDTDVLKSTSTMKYYFDSKTPDIYTGIEFKPEESCYIENCRLKMNIKSTGSTPTLDINNGALRLAFNNDNTEISTTSSMTIKTGDESINSSVKLSNDGLNLYSSQTAFTLQAQEDLKFESKNGPVNFKGQSIDFASDNVTILPKEGKFLNIRPKLIIHDGFEIDGEAPSITVGGVKLEDGIINADIVGISDFSGDPYFDNQGGHLRAYIDALGEKVTEAWSHVSDLRLKNIKGDSKAGLKEIEKIKVKNYTFKNDEKQEKHVGVIAQDLKKIFPNSVSKGKDGYLQIKTDEIFYAACNAVKELYSKFLDLTAKVTGLDERLTALKKENAQLKAKSLEFEKRLDKLEAEN